MDKGKLLDKAAATAEERMTLARVLDKCEQARRRSIPTETGFLSPQEQAAAESLLRAADVGEGWRFFGGYEGAERRKLLFAPEWMDGEELPAQSGVRCLLCRFRAEERLTHRDFLGSLMALGITREKLGDILVGEGEAQLLADASIEEFLLREYTAAGRTKLTVSALPLEELKAPEKKTREIHDTVMSLRLDSVCASGFSVSRGRAAELIAAGKVELNWRPCLKADKAVAEGDTVSCRGIGKFEVAQVGGLSRKGRTNLLLKRYE
ncbi:MAG: RNA-binding protein [Oscillospiraceae bacterium]